MVKYLCILLLLSFNASAQPNIGFEDGTFNNWQCYIGTFGGTIILSPSPPTFDRHTIIGPESAKLLDFYGGFPILCPNGSKYSIRLGNSKPGAEAERITYTFTVPDNGAHSIIFNYAVVLENPAHSPIQQPKFTAKVYDVTDDRYIDCPSFDFVASSSLPGFKLSAAPGARGASIYYKDWSTAIIDLHAYHGKTVRLEFTTNDCSLGGHFGYSYLDLNEITSSPITGSTYCNGQQSVTLHGPDGFAGYSWYNADLSQQLGQGQSFTISPPPADLTSYALRVTPYSGLGCVDTLYTVVNKIDGGFKLNVVDTVYGCPGAGVDLTAPAITAGSNPGMALSYFNDFLGTSYLYEPVKVMVSGVYYIQGINAAGCMNILPIHVIVDIPPIALTDPVPVVYPGTVDLSKTFTADHKVTYGYYTNAEATIPLNGYTTVAHSGTYYIKAENSTGCINIVPVNVIVNPPPPYTITAPNAFTPNGDGVNDHFMVVINGVLSFESVKIFNRYGQMVFMAKSPGEYWDGILNGRTLPTGTYYWVFEGSDGYYNKKVLRSASITLLR
ncbi:hypothetical protein BH09BAC6_BH09BAC6_28640 [soil metagenome]